MKKLVALLVGMVLLAGVVALWPGEAAHAASCAGVETTVLGCNGDDGVRGVLSVVLTVVIYGTGAIGVIGVVIAGIMYMTARDDTQQVAKAKKRLLQIAIGMLAFAGIGTLLSWLIPGGVNIVGGSGSGGTVASQPAGNNGGGTTTPSGGNGGNGGGGGNGSNGGNGSGGGSDTTPSEDTVQPNGDRETGSEAPSPQHGSVDPGNDGWTEGLWASSLDERL